MQRVNDTSGESINTGQQASDNDDVRLVLTPEQRVRLARKSGLGIVRILLAQAVMALIVIVISWG
ncbi:hypothetical protein L1889_13270 [Paenalcaligenes niemegkensis]|uniref:hypothetical protein n=1 Tax=Paenalcaligenes niemegkensis TaxID=2895469 RepID=UPI001EE97031|nr:hypothetical protein [Paenalcaligenes niemegkensis]MCQ9617532.1 hypothetical protein [Paenalcaligenes niemegkensis]